ncbi:MAG: alpha/beta fold hydrolase [Pseudomonadota bacterium]
MSTPLVLVHGFMGGSGQWNCLRPFFDGKLEIVAVDLPGFGENNRLTAINKIGAFADWVIEEIRGRGVERYALLGHSMGGMIAQEIVRRDRDAIERLILYSTGSVGTVPGRVETMEDSKRRAKADGAVATARRISATWFLQGEEAVRYKACAAIAELASLPAILAGLDAMEAWSGREALGDLDLETLVLWGDRDRTYSWEQTHVLWSEIPDTRLAVLPACAHAVHMEKPALFADLLLDFLAHQPE